jgi:hypothetical protein
MENIDHACTNVVFEYFKSEIIDDEDSTEKLEILEILVVKDITSLFSKEYLS